jgi:transposase-like protein
MIKAIDLLTPKYPKVAELIRDAEHDVLAYFAFPEPHRRQIRSNKPLERLHQELRRKTCPLAQPKAGLDASAAHMPVRF